jgi:deoxyribodipyrimidine photo-lyase
VPNGPCLVWLRDDLRLADNAALSSAIASGKGVHVVFILDETSPGVRPPGAAARWWLGASLGRLSSAIAARGGSLILRRGSSRDEIPKLVRETGATSVVWNRRYGPARETDRGLKETLRASGVTVESFPGALLSEPFDMRTGAGQGYKVFTPFWKALRSRYQPVPALPSPERIPSLPPPLSDRLEDWGLHPSAPDWSGGLSASWSPGEAGAAERLERFIAAGTGYGEGRDRPAIEGTSRLSPHLRFGEISPAAIWRSVSAAQAAGRLAAQDAEKFLSELAWRDFCWHLLYHDEELSRLSWRRDFDRLAWRSPAPAELRAWRQGRTGYPIVDAGLRQLWTTGWMHNRVRMIAASFLTKHLLAHWRTGEAWFWDTLVDADEASNPAGWQWVAGTGADASPYFRIFNPVLQGEKFDPEGAYVRTWVPELARLSPRYIHHPWDAGGADLAAAGVKLGETYPRPIVEHAFARRRALDAYAALRNVSSTEGHEP